MPGTPAPRRHSWPLHPIAYLCSCNRMVRKIIALLLSFIVLVSTTGVVMATHTCLAGSVRNVSLFEGKNCCQEENTPCQDPGSREEHIAARCCITEFTYHRTGTVT